MYSPKSSVPKLDDYSPSTWNTPTPWSDEVAARAHEPVANLLCETNHLVFNWVPTEQTWTKANQWNPASRPLDEYKSWDFYGNDVGELTWLQLVLFTRALRTRISKPMIRPGDPLSPDMMFDFTIGELAFIASRNRNGLKAIGRMSPTAWHRIIHNHRESVEPYSAFAWGLFQFSYQEFSVVWGDRGTEWMARVLDAGLSFDGLHRYINAGIDPKLVLDAAENGIDPSLMKALVAA